MKLLKKSCVGIVLLLAGFTTAHASDDIKHADATTQLSSMSAEQKKQGQQYFASHSFEFSSIFKRHHPGPYWILEKTKEFQLSGEQIKQQEALKFAMAKSTISGNTYATKSIQKIRFRRFCNGAVACGYQEGHRGYRQGPNPSCAGDGAVSPESVRGIESSAADAVQEISGGATVKNDKTTASDPRVTIFSWTALIPIR